MCNPGSIDLSQHAIRAMVRAAGDEAENMPLLQSILEDYRRASELLLGNAHHASIKDNCVRQHERFRQDFLR